MKFKDINVKQVYYVNYNPFRDGEFKDNHLSVVLKKNKDKKTVIVIPLTSKEKGLGKNKILVDIQSLPERLKGANSYAVYDQVRTVNSGRLQPIYELGDNKKVVEVSVEDSVYKELIKVSTLELESRLEEDDKIKLYKEKINDIYMQKAITLAYQLKSEKDKIIIERIRTEIEEILYNISEYNFTEQHKKDGIENIINNIANLNLLKTC